MTTTCSSFRKLFRGLHLDEYPQGPNDTNSDGSNESEEEDDDADEGDTSDTCTLCHGTGIEHYNSEYCECLDGQQLQGEVS